MEKLRKALEVFRQHPEASEEDLIRGIEALGIGYARAGKSEQARPLFEEAVALRQEFGSRPLLLSSSKALLGSSLMDLGEYEEAEQIFLEHDRIEVEALGPRNFQRPGRFNNLGVVASRQGRKEAAAEYFREGLELAREILPPDHPTYHVLLSGLGSVLLDLQRPDEAEPMIREALKLRRAFLPEGHWKLIRMRCGWDPVWKPWKDTKKQSLFLEHGWSPFGGNGISISAAFEELSRVLPRYRRLEGVPSLPTPTSKNWKHCRFPHLESLHHRPEKLTRSATPLGGLKKVALEGDGLGFVTVPENLPGKGRAGGSPVWMRSTTTKTMI